MLRPCRVQREVKVPKLGRVCTIISFIQREEKRREKYTSDSSMLKR